MRSVIIYASHQQLTENHQRLSVAGAAPIWIRTQLVQVGMDVALDRAHNDALPGETVLNTIPASGT